MSKKTPLNNINLKIKPNKTAAVQEQFGGGLGMAGRQRRAAAMARINRIRGGEEGLSASEIVKISNDAIAGSSGGYERLIDALKEVFLNFSFFRNKFQMSSMFDQYKRLFYNQLKLRQEDPWVKGIIDKYGDSIGHFLLIFDHHAMINKDEDSKVETLFDPEDLELSRDLIKIFNSNKIKQKKKIEEGDWTDRSAGFYQSEPQQVEGLVKLHNEVQELGYPTISNKELRNLMRIVSSKDYLDYNSYCHYVLKPFYDDNLDTIEQHADKGFSLDNWGSNIEEYKKIFLEDSVKKNAVQVLMTAAYIDPQAGIDLVEIFESIQKSQAKMSFAGSLLGSIFAWRVFTKSALMLTNKINNLKVTSGSTKIARTASTAKGITRLNWLVLAMYLADPLGEIENLNIQDGFRKIKTILESTIEKNNGHEWYDRDSVTRIRAVFYDIQRIYMSKLRENTTNISHDGATAMNAFRDMSKNINKLFETIGQKFLPKDIEGLDHESAQVLLECINRIIKDEVHEKTYNQQSLARSIGGGIHGIYKYFEKGGSQRTLDRKKREKEGSNIEEKVINVNVEQISNIYKRKDIENLVAEVRKGFTLKISEVKEIGDITLTPANLTKIKDNGKLHALSLFWIKILGVTGEGRNKAPHRRIIQRVVSELSSLESLGRDSFSFSNFGSDEILNLAFKKIPEKTGIGIYSDIHEEALQDLIKRSDIRTYLRNRSLFGLSDKSSDSLEIAILPSVNTNDDDTEKQKKYDRDFRKGQDPCKAAANGGYMQGRSANPLALPIAKYYPSGDIEDIFSNAAGSAKKLSKEGVGTLAKQLKFYIRLKSLSVRTNQFLKDNNGSGFTREAKKFYDFIRDCAEVSTAVVNMLDKAIKIDNEANMKLDSINSNLAIPDLTNNQVEALRAMDPVLYCISKSRKETYESDYKKYQAACKHKIAALRIAVMVGKALDNSEYIYRDLSELPVQSLSSSGSAKKKVAKAPALKLKAIPKKVPTKAVDASTATPTAPTDQKYQRTQSRLLKSLNIKPADLVKRLQDAGYFGNDKKSPIKEEAKQEAFVYTSEFKEAIIKLQKSLGLPDCADDGKPCADGLYGSGTHKRWEAEKARAAAAQAKPAVDPFNGFTGRGGSQGLKIGKYLIWYSPGSIPKPTIELIDTNSNNVYSTKGKGIGFVSQGLPHYHPRKDRKLPADVKIPYDLNNTMHLAVSGMPSTIPAKDHDAWDAAYIKRRDGEEAGPTQDRTNSKADQKKKNKPTLQQRLKSVGIDAEFWLSTEKLKYSDNKKEGESMNSYLKTIVDTYVNSITRLKQIGMPSDEARELVQFATIGGIRASSAALEKKIKGHEVFMKTQITELPAKIWKDTRPGRSQLTYNIKARSTGKGSWSGEVGDPKAPEWLKMDFIGWDSNYVRAPHSVLLKLSGWAQNVLDKKLRLLYLEAKAAGEKKKEPKKSVGAPAVNPRPKKHRVKKDDKSAQFNMDDLLKQAIAEMEKK